jgi:hypothetical protein
MPSRILGAVGKCNLSLLFLPFVPLHNMGYKPTLGKVVVLALLRGVLPAWYFGGGQAPFWAFTKLIPFVHFVNFDS